MNASPNAMWITPAPTTGGTKFKNLMHDLVADNSVADLRNEIKIGGIDEKINRMSRDAKTVLIFDVIFCATKRGLDRITDCIAVIPDTR